ncbi:MAG: redoxin domain-containing protein [Candidatus Poseidoniales archaeon]
MNEEATAKTDTLIKIISLFTLVLLVIAFTSNPVSTGVGVGERVPPLAGKAYNGGGWVDYDIYDHIDLDWEEGNSSGTWFVLEFMDTDCPYCWDDAAPKMSDLQNAVNSDQWGRAPVQIIAVAVELQIDGHDSTRAEIQAFRDKNDGDGSFKCNSGRSACSTRDGGPHSFPYIDDLDRTLLKDWNIPGTPTYFIIQPNGIVAWSSTEANNYEILDAVAGLIPAEDSS